MPLRDHAEEIIALRPTHSLAEIGALFGVSREMVRLVLVEAGKDEETHRAYRASRAERRDRAKALRQAQSRARRIRPPNHNHQKGVSDEKLLAWLRGVAAAHGEPLTKNRYDQLRGEGAPSTATIVFRFGTWAKACAAAGVQPGTPLRNNYKRTFSDEAIFRAVADFTATLPEQTFPTCEDYDRWARQQSPTAPSRSLIQHRMGWNAAVRAARDLLAASR